MPDEIRTLYPKAYIVLKKDCNVSEQLKTDIIFICHNNLPDYMMPEEMEFQTELPRTERGKVDYRALEEMYNNKG